MRRNRFAWRLAPLLLGVLLLPCAADDRAAKPSPEEVLKGLREFYQQTAREEGSFQNGIDSDYLGMSDSAYSDLAAVTYAVTIHKTFGWKLPQEEQTVQWLLSRQQENGDFVNVAGTVDPKSPQGRVYNTTQALVALHALGVKPKYDPLPVFEEILKQDYKTLPAYSTSFFPLAYLCAGKPIPEQADRAIRALMVPDDEGYLNDHVAATFHSSHYYSLVGEPTPKGAQMVRRVQRDQAQDGSWLLNSFSRDRHATFDAVFVLKHEDQGDSRGVQLSMQKATEWALSCRNQDGGFGHFPGSTSDADANYFQIGTLVMTGFLKPVDPLPEHPELLSWGHLLPAGARGPNPRRIGTSSWVSGIAFHPTANSIAVASDGVIIKRWQKTGPALARYGNPVPDKSHLSSIAYSRDGLRLIAGSYDHSATVFDTANGSMLHTLKGHTGAITSVACSPGAFTATGSIDQTIRLWSADGRPHKSLTGHKSWVNAIAFLSDEILVSGSSDGTVKLWDVTTGQCTKTLEATKAEVRSIAVSRDGKRIAAGMRYGVTKVWDTTNWSAVTIEQKADDVWSVVFSADGQQVITAAGEWNKPTDIVFWDIATQKPVKTLRHTGEVMSLALSPDGKRLAAGGMDKAVSVWALEEQDP